uniref:Uncharacterized protein n=1 Tax=Syphacia muris TaxID=451379 RepID=A0A0N5AS78_9BILA
MIVAFYDRLALNTRTMLFTYPSNRLMIYRQSIRRINFQRSLLSAVGATTIGV